MQCSAVSLLFKQFLATSQKVILWPDTHVRGEQYGEKIHHEQNVSMGITSVRDEKTSEVCSYFEVFYCNDW